MRNSRVCATLAIVFFVDALVGAEMLFVQQDWGRAHDSGASSSFMAGLCFIGALTLDVSERAQL